MQSSSSAPRASRAHNPPGLLALADGTVLHGVGVGATGVSVGEVVFNTAMTGYQEILSDPSYHQQIVTLTASHVGNTGITVEDDEAPGPQVSGLIVRDVPRLALEEDRVPLALPPAPRHRRPGRGRHAPPDPPAP
jgi:hypothetical protein